MEGTMDEFERFWSEYPRRIAKGAARKMWAKTASIRPPIDEIISAVRAARKSEQWQKDDGAYICHPSTWLSQERWSDEHEITVEDAKEWYETSTGIEAMGASLGILPSTFANWPQFKDAVMRASKVQPITRAA